MHNMHCKLLTRNCVKGQPAISTPRNPIATTSPVIMPWHLTADIRIRALNVQIFAHTMAMPFAISWLACYLGLACVE